MLKKFFKNRVVVFLQFHLKVTNKLFFIFLKKKCFFKKINFMLLKKKFKKLLKKRFFKIFFFCSNNYYLIKKHRNTRMGKGKGSKGNWIIKIQSNNKIILFLYLNKRKIFLFFKNSSLKIICKMYKITYYSFINLIKIISSTLLFTFWFQLTIFNFFLYLIIFKNYFFIFIFKKNNYLMLNLLKSAQRFKKFKHQVILKKFFYFISFLPLKKNKMIPFPLNYYKLVIYLLWYIYYQNTFFWKIIQFQIIKSHFFNF
jgi:hypothetical protein